MDISGCLMVWRWMGGDCSCFQKARAVSCYYKLIDPIKSCQIRKSCHGSLNHFSGPVHSAIFYSSKLMWSTLCDDRIHGLHQNTCNCCLWTSQNNPVIMREPCGHDIKYGSLRFTRFLLLSENTTSYTRNNPTPDDTQDNHYYTKPAPWRYAFLPCGHLDFESAVTAQ